MSEKKEKNEILDESGQSRRNLLKLSAVGGVAMVTGCLSNTVEAREDGIGVVEHDTFPLEVSPDYKRFSEEQNAFGRWFKKHGKHWFYRSEPQEDQPGFTTIDWALKKASSAPAFALAKVSPAYAGLPQIIPPKPINTDFKFKDSANAHAIIKRAARFFGADLVGITRRDPRWDYANVAQNPKAASQGELQKMEEFLGFEPKTVIVLGYEMEYEAVKTAPSALSTAAGGDVYSKVSKTGLQVAQFLSSLGYTAVPAGNGLGLNVPYAIAAGLGENTRMGIIINHQYGPRIRLAKVYTDLELDEYFDKPVTFGVESFCENCMHCANKCPSQAITYDIKPSMAPPSGEDRGYNNPGVRKWYNNYDACLQYWHDSNTDCTTCMTSCPYNKPGFWHHRLIDKVNTILPGPMHKFMADMDLLHGYGKTFDEKAPAIFWDDKGRQYNGFGG